MGKSDVAVEYKGRYHVIEFQMVAADVIPVLGLQTATDLQLIQRLNTVASSGTQETKPEILSTYADQFRGIGALHGEYEIKIDESTTPAVHPPRRIPCMLKDKDKAELCRMEEMGIITKVEEPTKWVNPIVVFRKPNGDVRIYLDPVDLKKAVRREHYPLKTVEQVVASMPEAKILSTLNATTGFYKIKLAEESTWLTTFNTPFGSFKFERLPFGLVSAQRFFKGPCPRYLRTLRNVKLLLTIC